MSMTSIKKTIFSILILAIIMAAALCGHEFILPENTALSKTGFYFDTIITITAYTSDFAKKGDPFLTRNELAKERADAFLDSCLVEASKYENMLSKTKEGSDIYNINHADGKAVLVSSDTAYLLKKSVYYAELSGGVFDPTIGSVSELWDFSADTDKKIPNDTEIKDALLHVDYKNIEFSGSDDDSYYVTLTDPLSKIDLGGIAKGYIADKLKEKFKEEKIGSGIINLGGNILLIGSKKRSGNKEMSDEDFVIGIQKPFGESDETSALIHVSDKSIVTSGVYDRYFKADDKIYHHILDTKTGYPVESDSLSATVVSDSSVDGDALSTIMLSLGTKKGMELASSIPEIQVLFIKDNYEVVNTDNFPLN
ncbi:MAG: FAD:protein FMN transferase [Butyrivibrio sp.]|nr:FAD:protein FMN transferase [Butyrivibrio sp.]